MCPRVAPRARRRPISERRSRTEITMVFATPIPCGAQKLRMRVLTRRFPKCRREESSALQGESHWCHSRLTMFTKQVSRPEDSLDPRSWPRRRSRSSELEERPDHGPDPRFSCPTPSSDAFASPLQRTSRDPADRVSSSQTRRVNFSSTSGRPTSIPSALSKRKGP
jgi:hypothetical protein